jgi:hypothetical protein
MLVSNIAGHYSRPRIDYFPGRGNRRLSMPDLCRFSVPGSMMTFPTVHDGQGNVLLEQQAAVANPNFFNVFVDQVGGPPTWLKQADNLRGAFR